MAMTTDARGWVFQSLIGRLKTYSDALAPSSLDKFQSLIGRLKTDLTSLYQMWYNMFQSLIGRLKTLAWVERGWMVGVGFNPS